MALSMNNNIVEKINRWIDKNKDLFGAKILCSGIDPECARHIARLFPAASVVCLVDDRKAADEGGRGGVSERAAIDGGNEIVTESAANDGGHGDVSGRAALDGGRGGVSESTGNLHGPLFLNNSIKYYEGGKFDTVVSLDQSSLCPSGTDAEFPVWERGTLYLRRASLLMEYYEDRVHSLKKQLRPGGSLLSLVKSGHDEYFLGYCLAAAAEGLAVDTSSIRQILCVEDGEKHVLQGFTAEDGGKTDIHALLAENMNFALDRMNTAAEELLGKEAEIMLQADAAELLRGYHIYQGDQLKGKLAVYSSAQRPDVIYYFTDAEGDEPYLKRFHESDRDKLVRHMVGELHRQKASDKNINWKQLQLQDDWSETEI